MAVLLNADVGEETGNDTALIPLIRCANIACGAHAGNERTMRSTVRLCKQHNVLIGAHPSYPDRQNFGRNVMPASAQQIQAWVCEQTALLQKICRQEDALLHHIKPHGALYNEAAKNKTVAEAVATAVAQINPLLILFGLSGSMGLQIAEAMGVTVWHEAFADRHYNDDGSLVSRTNAQALIGNATEALAQVKSICESSKLTSINSSTITIKADTICVHSDGTHAIPIAKVLHQYLHS